MPQFYGIIFVDQFHTMKFNTSRKFLHLQPVPHPFDQLFYALVSNAPYTFTLVLLELVASAMHFHANNNC